MKKIPVSLCVITFLLFFSVNLVIAESPIKIGWIGPLTGNSAVLGIDSVKVIERQFAKYNTGQGTSGTKLKLVVEDDQYTTAKAVQAYKKLVKQDGAKIIFTLTYSAVISLAPMAEKDGVILIDPLDCDQTLAKLPASTFCIAKPTEDLAYTLIEHAVANKKLPLGIIYFNGDAFPVNMFNESVKKLKELGITEYLSAGYDVNTTDFKSILQKFKSKNIKSLLLYGYDPLGLAMYQARSLGVDAEFYTVATVTSPGFQAAAKGTADGALVAVWEAPRTPAYQSYLEEFQKLEGRQPFFDISTVPSYDTANIIIDYIKTNTSAELEAKKFQTYLLELKDYQGLSGIITMDPDGATRSFNKLEVKLFKDGKIVNHS